MKKILLASSLLLTPLSPFIARTNLITYKLKPINMDKIFQKKEVKDPFSYLKDFDASLLEQIEIQEEKEEEVAAQIETQPVHPYTDVPQENTVQYQSVWSGQILTPSTGTVQGPSGTERYYNLDMSGVVSIAKNQGIEGDYWVREDGVKMYGSYIICACGFDVRPRGTLVETSLGTGICLDTGGFAASDPYMVDIAVTW